VAGLAQRILDRRAADPGEGGERVERQGAGAIAALNLARNDAEDGELAEREGGGDLRRDSAAHGLATATLMAGLSVW
jgi:hypothetical protein